MISLTSRNNPKIKQIRALKQRKVRQATNLFVVEGIRHVGEAAEAGAQFAYVCYAPELLKSDYAPTLLNRLKKNGVPIYTVDASIFLSLADKDNPQGLLAVLHQPKNQLADLQPINHPWCVALVSPQDPGNIGTILRTLDAAGASGLLLLDDEKGGNYCADPYHPSAIRAGMGTHFWNPIVQANFIDFTTWAKSHKYQIYGTSAQNGTPYEEITHFKHPSILLMGNERQGLTNEQTITCHHIIRLPMHGHATSLNIAVATGIMLYKILEKSPLC